MGFEVSYDPCENIKIVKVIEKYPVLYDTRKYPTVVEFRGLADKAWTLIAAELGVSEAHLKQRWNNIRCCFKRYLRNKYMRKSTKTYYLAEYLNFMLPFTKFDMAIPKKQKKVNTKKTASIETTYDDDSDELDTSEDASEDHDTSDDSSDHSGSNDFEVKLVDSDGEEESYFISTNADTDGEVVVPGPGENPDWDFLSSLLPYIKKMTAQQKVTFRNAMLGAVDNALYGDDLV